MRARFADVLLRARSGYGTRLPVRGVHTGPVLNIKSRQKKKEKKNSRDTLCFSFYPYIYFPEILSLFAPASVVTPFFSSRPPYIILSHVARRRRREIYRQGCLNTFKIVAHNPRPRYAPEYASVLRDLTSCA